MTVLAYLANQIFGMSNAPLGPVDLLGSLTTKIGLFVIVFTLIAAVGGKTRGSV